MQMVDTAAAQFGSDRGRIFATGLSAGGGMTADLLADYPDVFAGGVVDSGLPAWCATRQAAASGCQCSSQNLTRSSGATRYATPIRGTVRGRGSRPGRAPPTPPSSQPMAPDCETNGPTSGASVRRPPAPRTCRRITKSIYNDSAGKPAVALFSVSGMGHGLAVNPGSGAYQCGTTGAYYLTYICSSYHTAKFWDRGPQASGGSRCGTAACAAGALTAAARATARTPSCPSIRASASSISRRCRSSRCGNAANFMASWASLHDSADFGAAALALVQRPVWTKAHAVTES